VDVSFDKVADFEGDEEVEPLVVIMQPKTISLPQPSERPRKKRIKTLASRTDLPLVRQFLAIQAKSTSSPSQSKSIKPKPYAKPRRKSFPIAIQNAQKARKQGGCSKQSPSEIKEIVSSLEELSLRDPEITLEE